MSPILESRHQLSCWFHRVCASHVFVPSPLFTFSTSRINLLDVHINLEAREAEDTTQRMEFF